MNGDAAIVNFERHQVFPDRERPCVCFARLRSNILNGWRGVLAEEDQMRIHSELRVRLREHPASILWTRVVRHDALEAYIGFKQFGWRDTDLVDQHVYAGSIFYHVLIVASIT